VTATPRRVFVANRGEIAVRIVRGCRDAGAESVVGASDVDRDGAAALMADRVVCIGPSAATESYLRADLVVQAALGTGCDAIHPGYGFLSESSGLADMARENGLTFIGPPAKAIELAGDKLRAREAAADAGLPVLPGAEAHSVDEAGALAADIGYPILVKAAGGGGGRGIKLATGDEELEELVGLAGSEAQAAFGDARVYLERYIASARHIEVQVAADDHGNVVHLGERDCSVQRRYQKVVEEAPAVDLDPERRAALCEAAVRFAAAIGYRNIGTVEFIVDSETGDFYFLEMNCRIQVEHPVTELVTGLDLIALQLQIAAGEPIGLDQGQVRFDGHAIECRLNAEDVDQGFRPSPGRLSTFEVPQLPRLRIDTHCHPGALISPYYDPLLAKLIAHADDRDAAIDLLLDALGQVQIEGVETNRALLSEILEDRSFRRGPVTTKWLESLVK
jgi:acetyl-CoA carboxylase biotin carboxylase subunit